MPPLTTEAFTRLALAAGHGTATAEVVGDTLSLAQAFQLALAHSERVSLATREIELAEIRKQERWNDVKPNLAITGTALVQRERVAGDTVIVPGEAVIAEARLQQPLFRKGFSASRAAGELGRKSASASREREHELLARDVTDVFVSVLRTRKLLELAQTSVTRAKTQYDLAVGRVRAGQSLKNTELLAMIDVRRAELQAVVAERDARTAVAAFKRVIGAAPPPQLEVPALPELPTLEQARALAEKRWDLKALELDVLGAREEVTAARGRRFWPRLDLDASIQVQTPKLFDRNFDFQVIGLLTIPLIQSGRDRTDIAVRENEVHVATLELEQQRKLVAEELARVLSQVESAGQAADIANKQLETAREHYKLVDKQVRLGAITFLEVTNAQAILVEAENAFEVATMDRVAATYNYLYAIGAIDLTGAKGGKVTATPAAGSR